MYAAIMHRLRPHQRSSSTSLIEPSAHGRDDDAPRIVRPRHTWRSPSAGVIGDHYHRFKRVINCGNRERCSICKMVPVGACLRSDQDVSKFLYPTNLDHILSNKSNCPFCELLLACLSKPENDLFASSHVSDHLKDSSKLGGFETSTAGLNGIASVPSWSNARMSPGHSEVLEILERPQPLSNRRRICSCLPRTVISMRAALSMA
jgi:hypothetical protein